MTTLAPSGEPTAAEWARMVREDQPLEGGEQEQDDFLYVQWRHAAAVEGERWSDALHGGREMRRDAWTALTAPFNGPLPHPDTLTGEAYAGMTAWAYERAEGIPEWHW